MKQLKPKANRPDPKEERPVIADPDGVLDKLLKPVRRVGKTMRRLRDNSKL